MQLHRRIAQFNACVPYAGIAAGARPEEVLLPALFSLLPMELAVGITVSPPDIEVRPNALLVAIRIHSSDLIEVYPLLSCRPKNLLPDLKGRKRLCVCNVLMWSLRIVGGLLPGVLHRGPN